MVVRGIVCRKFEHQQNPSSTLSYIHVVLLYNISQNPTVLYSVAVYMGSK